MRAAVRPLLLLVVLCGLAAAALSQPNPGAEANYLGWGPNSPAAFPDGVSATAIQKAAPGYTCPGMVIRVIDDTTGKTIDTFSVENPKETVNAMFTGLGSNRKVQVTADATFQSGGTFDPKHIEAVVTTP